MTAELTLEEAEEALAHVDPHSRDVWLRMAMALKSEFGDGAFEAWDRWSAQAKNYRERDARTQWKSVKPHGRVGIGTLIHHAKAGGWQPPWWERSEAERRDRDERQRKRQQKRRAQEAEEAEREAAWQRCVAEMAAECWDMLHEVGQSRYLGGKKVTSHGLRFATRALLLVTDEEAGTARCVTDRAEIRRFFDTKAGERDGVSFRYLKRGTLAVPMRDAEGTLWGLQFIFPAGAKTFLRHARKKGTLHLIGEPRAGVPLAIAEGYATAATVHEAKGWPVAVAWDAGNLAPVGRALQPLAAEVGATLAYCADDDHEAVDGSGRPSNPGREKAQAAAAETGGVVLVPQFREPAGRSDWNDLQIAEGRPAVARQLLEQFDAASAERPAKGAEEAPAEAGGEGGTLTPRSPSVWEELLVPTQQGGVKATLHNVITILENHQAWHGLYVLDAFANEIRTTRTPPYAGSGSGEALEDADGTEIAAWMGHPHHYSLGIGSGMALESVEAVARRRKFHPVVEYLDRIAWDGTPRLDHMLSDFFGATHDEYTAAVGRSWLMSAVARVRTPGCKVDFMVILEGKQGRGKSTAVRTLCGPQWFAEMMQSPQDKDFFQILTGRWLVEIPELQSFNKADRNRIKAAVSAQEDTYRPSYGRYARQFPRQNVFVGTTNDHAYLQDPTGARRFLPVTCGWIDIPSLERLRDQLWAEADVRCQRGEPWWELPEHAEEEQEARYAADAWEEPIGAWLDGECAQDWYPVEWLPVDRQRRLQEVTVADVMAWGLRVETGKQSRPEQMRVGEVLRRLGWQREQRRRNGRRLYLYVRPDEGG